MSQLLINQYLAALAKLRQISGTHRESVIREAFKDLLKQWGRTLDLTFIPEYEVETKAKERRYIDGALLHTLRVPFGYWEAKDEKDDIDTEIDTKFKRGYPTSNIIFEDSTRAVLIQDAEEVMRCDVADAASLEKLLKLFFSYERPEIEAFRKAVEQFKVDLPSVLDALRSMIDRCYRQELAFRQAFARFLEHAKEAINPNLVDSDVREMLIQHVLTGEVFAAVFPNTTYHESNSVARELHKLEATFFTGNTKHQTLRGLAPYYTAIRKAATDIGGHHEKQTFLKAIYEDFYKIYNPKAADRLGVIYTPNEIVRFMINSVDCLCERHFQRSLIDSDVDILDPATGTGTFICELIEHFSGTPSKLTRKYRQELHANEVAILPYYVANLNIEATYAAITGSYEEFPGLCFVDTLDNTSALRKHRGHIDDLFGSMSDDNIKRIRLQNGRRISVIIGNPPYNANQLNENENNKNREYSLVDKRIRETYVETSDSHKTKTYDMYARFVRWASDRLDENGVLAFITNRSYIEKRAFDGFRKSVAQEFSDIYVLDLGGDVRGEQVEAKGNVFGIKVGVAIGFFVKKQGTKTTTIRIADWTEGTGAAKLKKLSSSAFEELRWELIRPDDFGNWVAVDRNEFRTFLPLLIPKLSGKKQAGDRKSIFTLGSFGCVSNRDGWVYDFSAKTLASKLEFYCNVYNASVARLPKQLPQDWLSLLDYRIKWTQDLRRRAANRERLSAGSVNIIEALYRPFVKIPYCYSPEFNWSLYRMPLVYPNGVGGNLSIFFSDRGARAPFSVLATDRVAELHLCASTDGFQSVSLHRFEEGQSVDNITDWALDQFRKQYRLGRGTPSPRIDKEAIFFYVYGVMHDPQYRDKYGANLKRELPRIPFYPDFWRWAHWGKRLIALHVNYESIEPFKLARIDVIDERAREAKTTPKVVLKADKKNGRVVLDTETTLSGIPAEAWEYKLGNRSALEWVLDQYKEKIPKDPTVRTEFNRYRFADYKSVVVNLLGCVTAVSVETMRIVDEMRVVAWLGASPPQ